MELTDRRGYDEDALGFTNQTAVLLCGMGAKELIPQFKDKNISKDLLADLSITDLQLLGADCKLANRMHKQLTVLAQRNNRNNLTPQQRLDQLFEVFTISSRRVFVIKSAVAYIKKRINEKQLDFFIEPNNNLRSSKALGMAVTATISEIKDAQLALEELASYLEGPRRSTYTTFYLIALGGVGLMTCLIMKKYCLN